MTWDHYLSIPDAGSDMTFGLIIFPFLTRNKIQPYTYSKSLYECDDRALRYAYPIWISANDTPEILI